MSLSFDHVTHTRSLKVTSANYALTSFPATNQINGNFNAMLRLAKYEDLVLRDPVLKEELLTIYAGCVTWAFLEKYPEPRAKKCLVLCASANMAAALVDYLSVNLPSVKTVAIPEEEIEIRDDTVDVWVGHRPGRGIFWGIQDLAVLISHATPMLARQIALLHHTVQGGNGQLVLMNNADDLHIPSTTEDMVNPWK